MSKFTASEIKAIIKKHQAWLRSEKGGERANLRDAILSYAILRDANLSGTNLSYAILSGANLSGAILIGANLSYANLRDAILSGTNLSYAILIGAILSDEQIKQMNHHRPFQIIPQEGEFIAWKKGSDGCLINILIPKTAKRTSNLVSRKCRASEVKVLAIWDSQGNPVKECYGWQQGDFIYKVGRVAKPDSYNDDIRQECTNGIHFFVTREEAEDW